MSAPPANRDQSRVPVAVIGASLAGMAVAARLALAGHRVVIHDRAAEDAVPVPEVIDLPAAWRDLFRKSGRPLDLELASVGYAWQPAPPTTYGSLSLAHGRADQHAAITRATDAATADRWQQFLDHQAHVWQALRPLGLEAEPTRRRLTRQQRSQLGWRATLATHATDLQNPVLADLLDSIAVEQHTTSALLPGWYATRHWIRRTFGRWQLAAVNAQADNAQVDNAQVDNAQVDNAQVDNAQVDNAVLLRLLRRRLTKRGVELVWNSEIDDPMTIEPDALGAAAVVDTTGGDRVTWNGPRSWLRRVPTTRSPGRYYAGPRTRAGVEPWAQLLSAGLAAYAVHRDRTGEDIRPTRKDTPRRRLL